MYIPNIGDYLKILTDDELKDFLVIDFGKYFKSAREKMYSNLSEERNLRKVVESLYIFLTTPDEVKNIMRGCNQVLLKIVYPTLISRF